MKFKSFLAEIKTDFNRYFEAGLIDDLSVEKWVKRALKKFGENIMSQQDTVIHVSNGKGELPANFSSIVLAVQCYPECYKIPEEAEIIRSNFYIERIGSFNGCDECDSDDTSRTIVENLVFNESAVEFRYSNPKKLRLGKGVLREACSSKCLNTYNDYAANEINIQGETLYTNFTEGTIYLKYYGLPYDEDDHVVIPESDMGLLEEYLEYHVKRKILEVATSNDDDKNGANLLSYYRQTERDLKGDALTSTKFQKLSPASFYRLKAINKIDMYKYSCSYPKI